MAAKIHIKNDRINSFDGIFFIIDRFRSSGLAALVDKTLGIKVDKARMDCGSYSQEVVEVTCCNCIFRQPRTHLRGSEASAGG